MATRVAINGFGRIGRCVVRRWLSQEAPAAEVVAINDLTDDATLAHLFKYDSIHGRYPGDVSAADGRLLLDGNEVASLAEPDPARLPWKDLEVDVVLECTGRFTRRDDAAKHLAAGARKVIISAPAKGADATFCYGINTDTYDPASHHVISNASCTTNCLAPVAKVLHETFGIENGVMTTVHAYTANQAVLDMPHKDLRRARACAVNIIPTTTGAAKAIGLVMPELAGKLDGMAMRVPVSDVSVVDLVVNLGKPATREAINDALRAAAAGPLAGILAAEDTPLVSQDFRGDTHSSIADLPQTMVTGGRTAKVLAWYDNEMGYASRLWDMCSFVAQKL